MRILLSENSKKKLLYYLMKENFCNSIKDLSISLKIPLRTLQEWVYNKQRYIPEKIIPVTLSTKLEILDKKEENWGSVKGGKKTYKIILKKYGKEEIKKRQVNGGKKSTELRVSKNEKFILNFLDPLFLEFYGILLGDGWIGRYKYKNKVISLIGISGHAKLDRNFFLYCKNNIKRLFNRNAYLKERPKFNSIELQFSHKTLLKSLNEELDFPIGKKINLKIHSKIARLGFNKLRYVLRGIFDTDGSFYLDKTPVGNSYPCISIQMKAPKLIKQLREILINEGFKVVYKEERNMITLKGSKQLKKWMEKIGSSNPKHLNKINALVAQSG